MPTYLDFNNTKVFRDYLISRTLNRPNGPQTFTDTNYVVQNLNNFSNVDPGDVKTNWSVFFANTFGQNLYSAPDNTIEEYTDTTLPMLAWINNGVISDGYFDSFTMTQSPNLIGIMGGQNFESDSRLMKFATQNIRENKLGPVFARIQQNLESATLGRVRLIDALEGNTATAINLITGREPLVEKNYKITVDKTLIGKGVDFLQTVAGLEFPFSEIPGDYLTNPRNPIKNSTIPKTETGTILQDVTGVLGSLVGIERRPKLGRKPSDLFVEYMGEGQRQTLYDQLSYSKYAPNYTTTARSQQSSKIFNFADRLASGVKNLLGLEAPKGVAYIGDDRSEDVKYTMSDFNDRVVKSSYYLSLLFDPVQSNLFEKQRNISQGGAISGKLTWISKNSQNKIGLYNNEFQSEESNTYNDSKSTNYNFRDDSILGLTQEILDSMPKDGIAARTHVGNVIDQTSRIFKEGDSMLSRGSAIKFVDKFNQETGAEYCRVWTKDRSYMNYTDTMKRTANIRKFDDSVMGGDSRPWNINMAPMSSGNYDPNGNNSFGAKNSTNIFQGPPGEGFYAKKYMFSIENLAWKTSNTPGFTYNDLPYCERGNNGGRVMWFPPYDLKVNENNSARWTDNTFLGRPEPIYTYQDTSRTGTISFKVIVDHPSILNLLVREHFKGMSDDESENYINAFFAGCEELDFYDLVRRYSQLDRNDIRLLQNFLDKGKDPEFIQQYKVTTTDPPIIETPTNSVVEDLCGPPTNETFILKFDNDKPDPNSKGLETSKNYSSLYNSFIPTSKTTYSSKLDTLIKQLTGFSQNDVQVKKEKSFIFGNENVTITQSLINEQKTKIEKYFDDATSSYTKYQTSLNELKTKLSGKTAEDIRIKISSSASSAASSDYNERLAIRRSHSVLQDIFGIISSGGTKPTILWISDLKPTNKNNGENDKVIIEKGKPITIVKEYKIKDFGYDYDGKIIIESVNYGENFTGGQPDTNCVGKEFVKVRELGIYSPISFYCRQTTFELKYENRSNSKPPQNQIQPTNNPTNVITTVEPNGQIPISQPTKKPPIDPIKRIIAKTLSECFYFKKLEENDPIVFKSLKDKLKYFHPAFHSMTPEGLNSRLTFLLQCVRPGDTIPIKGISEDSDLNARNTSFGPPPICVVRIGDFYHSKVAIRDVQISYDDGGSTLWDLNPEGIGIQPMIANVTLQVSFIGGQGLSKPVERLQNALSSNFFANTEMYDERSISTNETIGEMTPEKFTKDFLDKLSQVTTNLTLKNLLSIKNNNNVIQGNYIGTPVFGPFVDSSKDKISYTELVTDLFSLTNSYFEKYKSTYNQLYTKYGKDITTMLLKNDYRPIYEYDVYTSTSPTPGKVLNLLGIHKKTQELSVYCEGLQKALNNFIDDSSSTYLVSLFSFDKVITGSLLSDTNEKILKPFIKKVIQEKINQILNNQKEIEELEDSRNDLIKTLDKLNFIIKNAIDTTIQDDKVKRLNFSGFTSDFLYKEYESCITYIEENHPKLTEDLSTNITFLNPTIQSSDFNFILSQLLHDKVESLMKEFIDTTLYPEQIKVKLKRKLESFIEKPKEKVLKLTKFKNKKTDKEINFEVLNIIDETDTTIISESIKLFSESNEVTNKLNFYRKK